MPSLILATSILLKDQIVWLKDVFKAGFSNLGSGVKVNVLADPRCRVELIDLEKMDIGVKRIFEMLHHGTG